MISAQKTDKNGKYISASSVAKMIGKSAMTVSRLCANGSIKSKKTRKKGGGYRLEIDRASVLKYMGVEIEKQEEKQAKEEKREERKRIREWKESGPAMSQLEQEDIPSGEISDNISVLEAERKWKIERARDAKRKNDVAEGKLLEVDRVDSAIGEYFRILQENQRQLVDSFCHRLKLGPVNQQVLQHQFQSLLVDSLRDTREHIGIKNGR